MVDLICIGFECLNLDYTINVYETYPSKPFPKITVHSLSRDAALKIQRIHAEPEKRKRKV